MSFINGFDIAASGLTAQRTRLNVTASNLANAETTRTPEGGPYIRRQVRFQAGAVQSFDGVLDQTVQRVNVAAIEQDQQSPTRWIHDPAHPDANPDGWVEMPNVNVIEEMTEMITASRSYEANATAFETLKKMAMRALSIG
jgi:flagellar basal-body rod protein FlgC